MTDFLLTNRAQLRAAMFRLLGSESTDEALTEHGEEVNEVANGAVQNGIWLAQKELIGLGFREWPTTAVLDFGAVAADGTRSAALPDDFLRLAGDERNSALLDSQGRPWGGLIDARLKRRAGSSAYWIEGGSLHLGRLSVPPTGAYIEYHYRHPVLESDDAATDPLDFPLDWRPLIPPFAATVLITEAWSKFGADQEVRVARALDLWVEKASRWVRKTQEPQKLRPGPIIGSKIFL